VLVNKIISKHFESLRNPKAWQALWYLSFPGNFLENSVHEMTVDCLKTRQNKLWLGSIINPRKLHFYQQQHHKANLLQPTSATQRANKAQVYINWVKAMWQPVDRVTITTLLLGLQKWPKTSAYGIYYKSKERHFQQYSNSSTPPRNSHMQKQLSKWENCLTQFHRLCCLEPWTFVCTCAVYVHIPVKKQPWNSFDNSLHQSILSCTWSVIQ